MPQRLADLDQYMELIRQWYLEDRLTQSDIVRRLQAEHDVTTSERSLRRYLKKWELSKNEYDTGAIEAEICQLFEVGLPYDLIIEYLRTERPEIKLKRRTLERRFKSWEKARYNMVPYTPELANLIRYLFYFARLRDTEILDHLQYLWGVDLTRALLIRIRMENGMKRKIVDPDERQEIAMKLEEFLDEYVQTSDSLRHIGRDPIQGRVRRFLQIPISRATAYEVYRLYYPHVIRERGNLRQQARARRVQSRVPGPNYMWCMDGYHKLRFAGFEIYAAIDAYSRKILWCNVSRSNYLSINVLYQFLQTVIELGFRPWCTRTDHGVETPLMAWVQFQLAMHAKPSVVITNPDGTETLRRQGHRFSDSHKYGTSKDNNKIEQWWLQLFLAVAVRWIVFFKALENLGDFSSDRMPDQVAVYFLYGNIIRQEVAEFVIEWNQHRIRFQPRHANAVTGHVHSMWLNMPNPSDPGAKNYGQSLADDPELWQLAHTLREPLIHYDFDSFLAPETERVCNEWLAANPLRMGDPERPYENDYIALRNYLEDYENAGRGPNLAFNEIPRGGTKWYRDRMQEVGEQMEAARREAAFDGDPYADWVNMDVHVVP